MSDLLRRIVSSSIAIVLLAFLILFAFGSYFKFVVAFVVALVTAIAIWEYGQFVKAKGGRMIFPALIVLSVAQGIAFFLSPQFTPFKGWPIIVFLVAMLILFALHFKEKEGAIVDLAVSSFGLLYIAVPMGMILAILYSDKGDGRWWFTYLIVVTKMADIGAYFAGNLWGKRKLAPNISPKKTIEGAIFGLLCAMIASFALFALSGDPKTYDWLFLGLLLGIVGQFGDLSESLLKRDANKKDSNSVPGLGGILDAVDSVLFNIPIIYTYLYFIL